MFCPKCAAQNLEGASFCRACGANIHLVAQALDGQLVPPQNDNVDISPPRRYGNRELSLDGAFRSAFMGLAFLLVAFALSFSAVGRGWWFWMLIPAFSMMGGGVAKYIRLREHEKRALPGPSAPAISNQPKQQLDYPVPSTGELMAPPPSVTEGTTRHLGAEAVTKHLDDASN